MNSKLYRSVWKLGGLAVIILAVACGAAQTPTPAAPSSRPAVQQPEATVAPPPAVATATAQPQASEAEPTAEPAPPVESLFTWEIEEVDRGTKPAIALSSDDSPHIAYMLEDLNGYVKSASRSDSGWERDTIAEGYFYGPLDLGIGPDDVQQVAYHDHQGGTFDPAKGDTVLAKKSDGQWSVEPIFDDGHDGWDVRIFVDSQSRAHISAIDPMEFQGDGVEYYFQDESGNWLVEDVGSGELTYKWATSVAVDSEGVAYVTYYDQNTNDLILASKRDGAWSLETVDSEGDTGLFAYVAIDGDNGVHISYLKLSSQSSGTIKYAVRKASDSAWKIEEIDELDGLEFGFIGARNITSLSLDGSGNPWIAYTDKRFVKLAVWDGIQWRIDTVVDSGSDPLGQLVSLKLDSKDQPHLTYFQVTSNQPLNGTIMYAKGSSK